MSNVLNKILQTKTEEIKLGCQHMSENDFINEFDKNQKIREFYQAIKNKHGANEPAVIAEVKKASPSKGVICKDFDPQKAASSYQKAGAACISVLTDKDYFQGHNDYLMQVKEVTDIPLLRKDFMISPWQIYQSKYLGADCILLIFAALDDVQLHDLTQVSQELGMEVLMEVHDNTEMQRALKTNARIIGINNRNLKNFVTSLDTSINLAPLVSEDRIVVSESGIHSADDIKNLQQHNINTFLIGEAFMKRKDPGYAMQRMLMC